MELGELFALLRQLFTLHAHFHERHPDRNSPEQLVSAYVHTKAGT
jgi:hypothetical protein